MRKTAIIIGAGPAGLTAAYEFLNKTDIKPTIYEATPDIGGISKTVDYKGNKIDIGGHRFFSKSDRVMKWWQDIFPLQGSPSKDDMILGRKIPLSQAKGAPDPEKEDNVMLIRGRLSRIFFLRKFFDYPLSINLHTLINLGFVRITRMGLSYLKVKLFPRRPERSLEDFFINRFGNELYNTFFKDYTEKVWGTSCSNIKPEWGAQRVKGLSIFKAISHAIRNILFPRSSSLEQKNTETSLIGQFMYPKYGPGQFWNEISNRVKNKGGQVLVNHKVVKINSNGDSITSVVVENMVNGTRNEVSADYYFSTMPVKNLILSFSQGVPGDVKEAAEGLLYRDFITVGLLLKKLKISNTTRIKTVNNIIPDNWIYIQDRDVKMGRIQVFNNWSPYMVSDPDAAWIGLEYFLNERDGLWERSDEDFAGFAIDELERIGFADKEDVLDKVVIRMPKTYPAYFGSYDRFDSVRAFVDRFENLYLIGRNGMHRYNNTDHSMLTAMVAVTNIKNGLKTKDNIWAVNTERDYLERK